jgi:hypothetical protein
MAVGNREAGNGRTRALGLRRRVPATSGSCGRLNTKRQTSTPRPNAMLLISAS